MKFYQYPKIEQIIIDVSLYLYRMQLSEEELKVNPLKVEYLKGYKDCLNDIRNRIRGLINEKEDKMKGGKNERRNENCSVKRYEGT